MKKPDQSSLSTAEDSSSRVRCLRVVTFCFYTAVVLLAVIHVCQSIVFSSGAMIPGYGNDSRLNNYFLEHVYQAFLGRYPLLSPGQFYPVHNTLLFSDNHFGTVLFYALFRASGLTIEGAFQAWFFAVAALNTIALLVLFRPLRIHPLIAGPLAFLGTSSSMLVFKMGHPQVLPFFPFILTLFCLIRCLQSRDARFLGWASLCYACQHLCYMYYGYLGTIVLLVFFLAWFLLFRDRTFWSDLRKSLVESRVLVFSLLAISGLVLVALYLPYARYASMNGTNPWEMLIDLAPSPRAWFSASPHSLLYSGLNIYKTGAACPYEKTLFAGWGIWLLTPFLFLFYWKRRDSISGRFCLSLTITWIVCLLFVTTWFGKTGNLYLQITRMIEPIRSFRAFGRIAYLLIPVQAVAAAIFLDHLFRTLRKPSLRWLVIGFGFFLAFETLDRSQGCYSKASVQARVGALVDAWRHAGTKKILVFAPGYSNRENSEVHLDAWEAALIVGGKCLNGYSGRSPSSHWQFLDQPTKQNAEPLLARFGISTNNVCFVTDWPEELKRSQGIRIFSLRGGITPTTDIQTITAYPLQEKEIPIVVINENDQDVEAEKADLHVSYLLYDSQGRLVDIPGSLRTRLSIIHAHEKLPMTLRVEAPSLPGMYAMRLSMVHEHVAWWADIGYPGSLLQLIVKNNDQDPSDKPVYSIKPVTDVKTLHLAPLQKTKLAVVIENGEPFEIQLQSRDIHVSYRLVDAQGHPVDDPGALRTPLPSIRARERLPMEMWIQAPSQAGVYTLHLTMVHEHIAWFMDVGYEGSSLKVIVP